MPREPLTRFIALAVLLLSPLCAAALPPEVEEGLKTSKFIYVSSTRKDGSLSRAAEIWFLYHRGAVYVASSPGSWRAPRIRWGRPGAKIWVGRPDGPAFAAKGAIVREPEIERLMMKSYAEKYPDGWKNWQRRFEEGFKSGERVLIKYTPDESR